MARALVPLKDLVAAKTRLGGLLRPAQRRALAQAMVEDVLAVLHAHPRIERVALLSDDPCAHRLAAQYGALHLPESRCAGAGLNTALERGIDCLAAGYAGTLVILHGDLPLLRAGDIDALLDARKTEGELVIAADRAGEGTNALAFDHGSRVPFRFGAGSCEAHRQAARARQVPVSVLRRGGLGLDVDSPQDLDLLRREIVPGQKSRTAELLAVWAGESCHRALDSVAWKYNDKERDIV